MSIEVTQADREAAMKFIDDWRGRDETCPLMQAFARHRIAAYEAGVLDGTMKAVREMRKDSNRPKRKEPLTCRGENSE